MSIYCMNLQCVLYMLVKTRSFCHPSFESSKRSKSTYFTQFTNIAYIQRLIPPHSRGVSPHIYIFYESALLLLHAGQNQKSVSFIIRVQQRIKVDLLHSVNKNRPTSTPHSSKTKGVSPPQMLPERSSNASALVQSKSQVRRPLRYGATGVQSHPILVTVTACRL